MEQAIGILCITIFLMGFVYLIFLILFAISSAISFDTGYKWKFLDTLAEIAYHGCIIIGIGTMVAIITLVVLVLIRLSTV